jgi:hypothetical protein
VCASQSLRFLTGGFKVIACQRGRFAQHNVFALCGRTVLAHAGRRPLRQRSERSEFIERRRGHWGGNGIEHNVGLSRFR